MIREEVNSFVEDIQDLEMERERELLEIDRLTAVTASNVK